MELLFDLLHAVMASPADSTHVECPTLLGLQACVGATRDAGHRSYRGESRNRYPGRNWQGELRERLLRVWRWADVKRRDPADRYFPAVDREAELRWVPLAQ